MKRAWPWFQPEHYEMHPALVMIEGQFGPGYQIYRCAMGGISGFGNALLGVVVGQSKGAESALDGQIYKLCRAGSSI